MEVIEANTAEGKAQGQELCRLFGVDPDQVFRIEVGARVITFRRYFNPYVEDEYGDPMQMPPITKAHINGRP